MGWLLVLGLKECMVECATVCDKSAVVLLTVSTHEAKAVSYSTKLLSQAFACSGTLD